MRRNLKSLFLKYEILEDRLRLQTILPFLHIDAMFEDITEVRETGPLVFMDIIRESNVRPYYWFGLRIIKNDLADLYRHLVVSKKAGYWRQIHFTPRNAGEFYGKLKEAMGNSKVFK